MIFFKQIYLSFIVVADDGVGDDDELNDDSNAEDV